MFKCKQNNYRDNHNTYPGTNESTTLLYVLVSVALFSLAFADPPSFEVF